MKEDNLVHADTAPALSQDGQQTSVQTPLEIMAKAVGKALHHNDPDRPFTDAAWAREMKWWREAKEEGRANPPADISYSMYADKCFRIARAALLALAEAEIPETVAEHGWDAFMDRDEDRIDPSPNKDMKVAFRSMLRFLAKEDADGN